MLQEILDNNRIVFADHFDSYEDAIKASYKPLLDEHIVDDEYIDVVNECVKKYGPYIVITDDIAMPHSSEDASGCHGTAISFMHVKEPVDFGEDVDGHKQARLFFALAANNHDAHLKNIQDLMNVLMNEDLVAELLAAENKDDLSKIVEKYNM